MARRLGPENQHGFRHSIHPYQHHSPRSRDLITDNRELQNKLAEAGQEVKRLNLKLTAESQESKRLATEIANLKEAINTMTESFRENAIALTFPVSLEESAGRLAAISYINANLKSFGLTRLADLLNSINVHSPRLYVASKPLSLLSTPPRLNFSPPG